MKTVLFLLLAITISFSACKKAEKESHLAFYHWKTNFSPSQFELDHIESIGTERLYIKYFDVDWDPNSAMAVPLARIQYSHIPEQEIVPTIFITNRAIRETKEENASKLADKVFNLIFSRHPEKLSAPKEIQIDCDWTQGTRSAYFAFLKHLNHRLDSIEIKLSATIRLHQIKFHKQTGVPPVDRGMLMFYNMGELDNPQEENSILDVAEGKRYLDKLGSYPLPLDAALPLFSWAVLIRQEKPIKLINNLRKESVSNLPWLSNSGQNQMQVDTSHYLEGHFLYPGDRLRFESVSIESLKNAAELLQERLAPQGRHIAFYHLDSLTLTHYKANELREIFEQF